jgi:hypothetical protein
MASMFIAFGLAVATALMFVGIWLRQRRVIARLRRRNSELWIDWKTGVTVERFQQRRIAYLSKRLGETTEAIDVLVEDLLESDSREDALATRCHDLESKVETLRATVSRGAA